MWTSTNRMKTTPETAISSFRVIVEREALVPLTSGVVSAPCMVDPVFATKTDATPAHGG